MQNDNDLTQKLVDLEMRVLKIEEQLNSLAGAGPESSRNIKRTSAGEFLSNATAKLAWEKTLVLAFYVEAVLKISPWNVDDLIKAFREAKEIAPKNLNDTVNKIIKKSLAMEEKGNKGSKIAWVLTRTGESKVEELIRNQK